MQGGTPSTLPSFEKPGWKGGEGATPEISSTIYIVKNAVLQFCGLFSNPFSQILGSFCCVSGTFGRHTRRTLPNNGERVRYCARSARKNWNLQLQIIKNPCKTRETASFRATFWFSPPTLPTLILNFQRQKGEGVQAPSRFVWVAGLHFSKTSAPTPPINAVVEGGGREGEGLEGGHKTLTTSGVYNSLPVHSVYLSCEKSPTSVILVNLSKRQNLFRTWWWWAERGAALAIYSVGFGEMVLRVPSIHLFCAETTQIFGRSTKVVSWGLLA